MPFFQGGGGHGTFANVHPQAKAPPRNPAPFMAGLQHALGNVGRSVAQAPRSVATPHSARVQYPVNRPTFDPRKTEPGINPVFGHIGQTLSPMQFALQRSLLTNHVGTMFPNLTNKPLGTALSTVNKALVAGGYLNGGKSFVQGVNKMMGDVNFDDKAALAALRDALKAPRADSQGTQRYAPTRPDSLGTPVPQGASGQLTHLMPIPIKTAGKRFTVPLYTPGFMAQRA